MTPITFPDRIKVCQHILQGKDCVPIDREMADIIYHHFQNKSDFFIEYERWDDPRIDKPQVRILDTPMLWYFSMYIQGSERWKLQRNYSRNESVANWIRKANIEMISKHVQKTLSFDEDRANALAARLVNGNLWGNVRGLGCNKRITKEEEL